MTDDDIIRRVTLLNAEAAERAIEEIPYGIRSAGVIMFAQCFVAELRASVKAEPAPLAPVPRGACRPGSSDLANDASYLRPGVWTPPACAPKKSVPRGCCGRCDRCGESKLGKCCVLGQCSTFPQPTQRSHCAGCGAPYEAELSQADVNAAGYRENANEPLPTRKEGDACDSVARHNDRTGPANVTPPAVDSTSVAGEVMAFGPPNNATNTDAWRSTNWHPPINATAIKVAFGDDVHIEWPSCGDADGGWDVRDSSKVRQGSQLVNDAPLSYLRAVTMARLRVDEIAARKVKP